MKLFCVAGVLFFALTALGDPGVSARGDLFKRRTYETFGALSLFVDTAGSDSNACTSSGAGACLTIQGALAKVPQNIHHPVTITVGSGTFGCAYVGGFKFWAPTSASAGAYLFLQGTFATSTVATGTATGTSTAATAPALPTSFGTITDAAQTWTVNDLRGRFVIVGSVRAPIVSNTATVVTYGGAISIGTGAGLAYTIQDAATVMSGTPCDRPASGFVASAGAGNAAMLWISNGADNLYVPSTLTVQGFRFTNATGRAIQLQDGSLQVNECQFITTASPILWDNTPSPGSRLSVDDSVFNLTAGTTGIAQNLTSPGSNILFVNGAVFYGAGIFGINIGPRFALITASSFALTGAAPIAIRLASGEANVQLNRIDCGLVASSTGINVSAVNGFVAGAGVISTDISNCITALSSVNRSAATFGASVTGMANTTALNILTGGRVDIATTTTLTGTTEISLDGTTYTFAALRALVPKQITDATTLSTVREP